jgi:DNA-binding HxlR family transcriptional regulator
MTRAALIATGIALCKCGGRKHVIGCASRRGPKRVPMGSIGSNVLIALKGGPMTFDAIKKFVVDNLIYADSPALRRMLAKSVYEMHRHGYVARRGDHGPLSFAKHRRWEITPAGRDAIAASMDRQFGESQS